MTGFCRGGGEIETAQVGDPLELRFEILDMSSPYEIFVRDLVAKDGNDQSEITLLDESGCPAEGQIMGPLIQDPSNPKVLHPFLHFIIMVHRVLDGYFSRWCVSPFTDFGDQFRRFQVPH